MSKKLIKIGVGLGLLALGADTRKENWIARRRQPSIR